MITMNFRASRVTVCASARARQPAPLIPPLLSLSLSTTRRLPSVKGSSALPDNGQAAASASRIFISRAHTTLVIGAPRPFKLAAILLLILPPHRR